MHIPSFFRKPEDLARQGPYFHMATISSSWVVIAPFSMKLHYEIPHNSLDHPHCLTPLGITQYLPGPQAFGHTTPAWEAVRGHWLKCIMVTSFTAYKIWSDSLARPSDAPMTHLTPISLASRWYKRGFLSGKSFLYIYSSGCFDSLRLIRNLPELSLYAIVPKLAHFDISKIWLCMCVSTSTQQG